MTPDLLRRRRGTPIELACAADRRWLGDCAAMVDSVLRAQRAGAHVHLLAAPGVSPREQALFREMVEARGGELSIYHPPTADLGKLVELGPAASWYRMLLSELLPDTDRVIYLDADAIVVDRLDQLWRIDLRGHAVGAVPLVPEEGFSAAVMLADLARMRELGVAGRATEIALAAGAGRVNPTQAALNAVLGAGELLPIPGRWNVSAGSRSAVERPAVIHFHDGDKVGPDRDVYWSHRNRTPWPAEPPDGLTPAIHANAGHPHEEFFEPWREHRRQRYAGKAGEPLSRAVFTVTHNEGVFLPIWLRYYSRHFNPDDIYVLDHDTTDGSTDGDGFVRIPISHDRVEMLWIAERVAELQRELLGRYDVVLFTDTDEIMTPDPAWGDLSAYLDRFDEPFVNPLGYELLHLRDREPPLDLERPILDQRRYWFANDAFDKPVLAREPIEWVPGFHRRADGAHNYDPDLRLIHLRRMDYDISLDRQRSRVSRSWDSRDVEEGWSAYNRLGDDDYDRWFHADTGFEAEGISMVLEPIPERWRGLI